MRNQPLVPGTKLKVSDLAFLIGIIGVAFIDYWLIAGMISSRIDFNIYFVRDIHRAFDWLHGTPVWPGSDMKGGGYTPGPFFYWLIAPALGLFGTWTSAARLMIGYYVAAHVFTAWVFSSRKKLRFFLYFFLLGLIPTAETFIWLNNASLNVVAALVLISISKLIYDLHESQKGRLLYYLCLLLFLSALFTEIQISILFVWIGLFWIHRHQFAQVIAQKPIQYPLLFGACFLLPMLPGILHFAFASHPDLFGHGRNGLLNLRENLADIRKLVFVLARPIKFSALWSNVMSILFGLAGCFISGALTEEEKNKRPWFAAAGRVISILCIAMVPWLITCRSQRYFRPLSALIAIWMIEGFSLRPRLLGTAFTALVAIPCLLYFHAEYSDSAIVDRIPIEDFQGVANFFSDRNMSFEDFRRSSVEVLGELGESSYYLAQPFFHATSGSSAVLTSEYLLVNHEAMPDLTDDEILQRVPLEIRLRVTERWPERRVYKVGRRMQIYEIPLHHTIDDNLSNLSDPYRYDPLREDSAVLAGAHLFSLCEYDYFCRVYWKVVTEKSSIRVLLDGRMISAKWSLPPVASELDHVFLQWTCGNSDEKFVIAERLGTLERRTQDMILLAPLEVRVPSICANPENIRLVIGSAQVSYWDDQDRERTRNLIVNW